jgi:hypothetical protein
VGEGGGDRGALPVRHAPAPRGAHGELPRAAPDALRGEARRRPRPGALPGSGAGDRPRERAARSRRWTLRAGGAGGERVPRAPPARRGGPRAARRRRAAARRRRRGRGRARALPRGGRARRAAPRASAAWGSRSRSGTSATPRGPRCTRTCGSARTRWTAPDRGDLAALEGGDDEDPARDARLRRRARGGCIHDDAPWREVGGKYDSGNWSAHASRWRCPATG